MSNLDFRVMHRHPVLSIVVLFLNVLSHVCVVFKDGLK